MGSSFRINKLLRERGQVRYHKQRDSSTCFSQESDIWWWLQVSPVSFLAQARSTISVSTWVTWLDVAFSIASFPKPRHHLLALGRCCPADFHLWWCAVGAWRFLRKCGEWGEKRQKTTGR